MFSSSDAMKELLWQIYPSFHYSECQSLFPSPPGWNLHLSLSVQVFSMGLLLKRGPHPSLFIFIGEDVTLLMPDNQWSGPVASHQKFPLLRWQIGWGSYLGLSTAPQRRVISWEASIICCREMPSGMPVHGLLLGHGFFTFFSFPKPASLWDHTHTRFSYWHGIQIG